MRNLHDHKCADYRIHGKSQPEINSGIRGGLMKILEIKHLKKSYRGHQVLEDINFSLKPNQIFGLIGPNGVGKTTIIGSICGLVKYDKGTILLDGRSLEDEPQLRRKIGCCFQEPVFDRFFNIRDTIAYNAMYHGLSMKEARDAADLILDQVKLSNVAHLRGSELSGGMKKRFQLAIAMVFDPEILILDEPTAGVDLELSDLIQQTISAFSQRKGKSVILTGHDIKEMQILCSQAAFIQEGVIIKNGTVGSFGNLEKEYRRLYIHDDKI